MNEHKATQEEYIITKRRVDQNIKNFSRFKEDVVNTILPDPENDRIQEIYDSIKKDAHNKSEKPTIVKSELLETIEERIAMDTTISHILNLKIEASI